MIVYVVAVCREGDPLDYRFVAAARQSVYTDDLAAARVYDDREEAQAVADDWAKYWKALNGFGYAYAQSYQLSELEALEADE